MDAATARAILRKRRNGPTKAQIAARSAIKSKAEQHFRQALALSDEGVSFKDAAKRIGITSSGLSSLLYRELGSTVWPVRKAVKP